MVFKKKKKGIDVRDLEDPKPIAEETPDLEVEVETPVEETVVEEPTIKEIPQEANLDDEVEELQRKLDEAQERRDAEIERKRQEALAIESKTSDAPRMFRILKGELVEGGFVYTILANKSLGEIGEVLNV